MSTSAASESGNKVIAFKKRQSKVIHARKRDSSAATENDSGSDKNGASDEESEDIDFQALSDIRLQQRFRVRKAGASISTFDKGKDVPNGKKKYSTTGGKSATIETVMENQYSSQMDYGMEDSVPHKRLMDAFIDEKLGLKKNDLEGPTSSKPVSTRMDDELYKVPEHIKVPGEGPGGSSATTSKANSGTGGDDNETNGVASAWSTCIAEVALPIHFKLQNIEETERIAKQQQQRRGYGYGYGGQRSSAVPVSDTAAAPHASTASLAAALPVTGKVPIGMGASAVPPSARLPFSRFRAPDNAARMRRHWGEEEAAAAAASTATGTGANGGGRDGAQQQQQQQQQHRDPLKRHRMSNDDFVMQKYKKRQMELAFRR